MMFSRTLQRPFRMPLPAPRRQFTSVIDVFSTVFVGFHAAPLALPWSGAIVAGTVLFRLVFTLPLAVVQRSRVRRLAAVQPVLRAWEATLRRGVVLRHGPLGDAAAVQTQFKAKAAQLYAANRCSPTATFLLPWTQVPLFLAVSLAVRRLAGLPPVFVGAPDDDVSGPRGVGIADSSGQIGDASGLTLADAAPTVLAYAPVDGFTTEGFLWFLDLSVPDPTVVLPLIVGALHLANIETHSSAVAKPTARQRAFKILFQSVAVLMVPIATQVPSGVALYWATSAAYSLVQNHMLQILYSKPIIVQSNPVDIVKQQ